MSLALAPLLAAPGRSDSATPRRATNALAPHAHTRNQPSPDRLSHTHTQALAQARPVAFATAAKVVALLTPLSRHLPPNNPRASNPGPQQPSPRPRPGQSPRVTFVACRDPKRRVSEGLLSAEVRALTTSTLSSRPSSFQPPKAAQPWYVERSQGPRRPRFDVRQQIRRARRGRRVLAGQERGGRKAQGERDERALVLSLSPATAAPA